MGLSLALVGCGAMGSALLKGWLTLSDSQTRFKAFWVIAPHRANVEPFLEDPRVQWVSSPQELPEDPDIIVFAVKPFIMEEILPLYKAFHSLFITVATGKSLAFYEKFLSPPHSLIRAMPNTPVTIHQGVIALLANATLTADQKRLCEKCFEGLGFCTWVKSDEDIDKITAISGSGPAYVFYLIESLAQAAESIGFDKETASNLALYTFWGASTYAHISNDPPSVLRQHVTSPKGTTAAALNVLETDGFYNLMEAAVKAAYNRARELGDERKSV
ncbi:MAG: pyrroline-5-carboxylate reductase [Alphaproteobacteria bacterium 41-28]|nr:MAG: pyrroline-5-carboxylate reductase [Alphaproteobacteria bacterium 41-28]